MSMERRKTFQNSFNAPQCTVEKHAGSETIGKAWVGAGGTKTNMIVELSSTGRSREKSGRLLWTLFLNGITMVKMSHSDKKRSKWIKLYK